MNAFLIDLWNDLREKRLWPVAALLLLGLIAVPIVLSEPSKEPVSATVVAVSPPSESGAAKGLAALTVAKDDPGDGSSLDVFDSSNPFKPPQDIIANSDDTTAGPDLGHDGRHRQHRRRRAPPTRPDAERAAPAPDPRAAPPSSRRRRPQYRYVIDATFITNGEKRKIDGMDALSVLPSHSNALLVFLGVRSKGGNAVFIVDSTLSASATGDGKCKPKQGRMRLPVPEAGREGDLHDRGGRHLRPQGSRHPQGQDRRQVDHSQEEGVYGRRRRHGRDAQSRAATLSTRLSRSSSRTS